MTDIVPELLDAIKKDFEKQRVDSKKIQALLKSLNDGTATYKDAHAYAVEVGEILSKVLNVHITAETLPDGKMYFNIADRVLNETLKNNYSLVSDYTEGVQTRLNQQAGLKLRAQRPDFDQDRIKGFINKLSSADDFADVQWVLGDPMVNFTQSVVDDSIKKNAKFHSDAGMKSVIKRQVKGKACKWCRGLEGTYDYPKGTPNEVFHRHENCRCVTEYYPKHGKGVQDVWSKLWRKRDKNRQQSIERVERFKAEEELIRLKKDIRDLDLSKAKPSDIIKLGRRVNYQFNVSEKLGNKEELKNIFSNFREMGGTVPKEQWYPRSNKTIKKQIQNAFSYYPKDWANYLADNDQKIFAGKKDRGFFSPQLVTSAGYLLTGAKLNEGVSIYASGVRATTPFHEIGHMVEHFNPDVLRIGKEWVNSRTTGEEYTRLKDIFPNSNYKGYEVTKKDNFISPYIGKNYEDATEVLSMGLESIFEPGEGHPKCFIDGKIKYSKITEDEEYLNLILGLLLKG